VKMVMKKVLHFSPLFSAQNLHEILVLI
jgi:hypothetical protein